MLAYSDDILRLFNGGTRHLFPAYYFTYYFRSYFRETMPFIQPFSILKHDES